MNLKRFAGYLIAGMVLASLPSPHPIGESDLKDQRADITTALQQLEPGVATRADVEALLRDRDSGPQGISSTRYYAEPGLIVEVPYDQTGGTWTSANRVNGPITMTRGPRHTF